MSVNVEALNNEERPVPEESTVPIKSPDVDKIAELAYYKAESRGFAPGYEMDDWLEAERELTGRCE